MISYQEVLQRMACMYNVQITMNAALEGDSFSLVPFANPILRLIIESLDKIDEGGKFQLLLAEAEHDVGRPFWEFFDNDDLRWKWQIINQLINL